MKFGILLYCSFAIGATPSVWADVGTVMAWGFNNYGQSEVPSDLGTCVDVSASGFYSIAIQQSGFARCWGAAPAVPSDVKFKAVAAGKYHALLTRVDGVTVAYGDNGSGQCSVPADLGLTKSIAAGESNSAAIQNSGVLRVWGLGTWGVNQVPSNVGAAQQVALGANHALALTVNGLVRGWGNFNTYGQSSVPTDLGLCTAVAAASFQSLALKSDGTVVTWGGNFSGVGSIPSDAVGCTQIATSGSHSAALSGDKLLMWGNNLQGQCTLPTDLGVCSKVVCGQNHTVALQRPRTTVVGVQPISGPQSGGTRVTISGTNFTSPATVLFNGIAAEDAVVVSDTQVTATTPAGFPGPAEVRVNLGFSTAFYYRPECGSDLDQNGTVDAGDISIILLDFGPCYEPPAALAAPAPTPLLADEPPQRPVQR
jgi:alpha-tubulin suppressor-like RCC1 family protein